MSAPDIFALGGRSAETFHVPDDPVIALSSRLRAILDEYFRLEESGHAAGDQFWREATEVKQRFMTTPAMSTEGLIAQLTFFKEFADASQLEDSQIAWFDTIIAGVRTVGQRT